MLFGIVLLLTLFCAIKPVAHVWDAQAYVDRYHDMEFGSMGSEPFSYLLLLLSRPLHSASCMFALYALLSVGIKCYAIKRYASFVFLSVSIFISHIFLLQDFVQIRMAVASAIALLSLSAIKERHFHKFLCYVICATLFHYSAMVWLFTYFLNPDKIKLRWWMFFVPASYLLALIHIQVGRMIELIPVAVIQELYKGYMFKLEEQELFTTLNIFSTMQLLRLLVYFVIGIHLNRLAVYNKYTILVFKIFTAAMVAFVMLSDIPVIAMRISEFLQVSMILLFPMLAFVFKPRKAGIGVVLAVGATFICLHALTGQIYI